jgi:hypothetical protein
MSPWLKHIPLKSMPRIGTGSMFDVLPDWAAFMVWYGWWQRQNVFCDRRVISLIIAPDRAYCSALCSLGVLLASTRFIHSEISWVNFLNLPDGFEIYFKDGKKNIVGRLGEVSEIYGTQTRKIISASSSKKLQNSAFYVTEINFKEKCISLIPHVNQHNMGIIYEFYESMLSDFDKTWLSSMVTECRVVTNKAQWSRSIEDVVLFVNDDRNEDGYLSCDLQWLLLTKNSSSFSQAKVSVVSPKALIKLNDNIELTFYDGMESLQTGVSNLRKSNNNVFILTHNEYDYHAYELISQLSQYRDTESFSMVPEVPCEVPRGIDVVIFTLPITGGA